MTARDIVHVEYLFFDDLEEPPTISIREENERRGKVDTIKRYYEDGGGTSAYQCSILRKAGIL